MGHFYFGTLKHMKATQVLLTTLIVVFFCNCIGRNKDHDQNKEKILKTDSINCYELKGNMPNLIIVNQLYYGRVFIGITYDSTEHSFEGYKIVRSTLWKKSDKSVFSNYETDTKVPIPEVYNEIVKEIKNRVDDSDLILKRKKNIEKCTDVNWLILPIEVK